MSKQLQQAERHVRKRDEELATLHGVRDELRALKERWTADAVALEQVRRELDDVRTALLAEREARVAAQSAAEVAIAQRAMLEAVFAKWDPVAAAGAAKPAP